VSSGIYVRAELLYTILPIYSQNPLWHGNVYKAFHKVAALAMNLDVAVATTGDATARKLLKAVEGARSQGSNP